MIMRPTQRPTRSADRTSRRAHLAEAGVSVIEVLIAALLFLVIMLGTLPLFTRSMTSNASGAQSTAIANDAKEQLESYTQLAFDDPLLNPGATVEYSSLEDKEWGDSLPPTGETLRGTRTTTIREYHISALDDGILTEAEMLPAGTQDFWISLKEIEVDIDGEAEGVLASTQDITHTVLKSQ